MKQHSAMTQRRKLTDRSADRLAMSRCHSGYWHHSTKLTNNRFNSKKMRHLLSNVLDNPCTLANWEAELHDPRNMIGESTPAPLARKTAPGRGEGGSELAARAWVAEVNLVLAPWRAVQYLAVGGDPRGKRPKCGTRPFADADQGGAAPPPHALNMPMSTMRVMKLHT
jgi:hypothetical protein